MAMCPNCNKQELQSGESACPHCSNKSTGWWLKYVGGPALAVGAVALAAAPKIVSAVLNKNKNNKS